jgi:hypothetical protein
MPGIDPKATQRRRLIGEFRGIRFKDERGKPNGSGETLYLSNRNWRAKVDKNFACSGAFSQYLGGGVL